jgi:hypothetical protein
VFRHRTHYLLAERGGEIVGVLPLAQVKSRLFGHSLVSLPFCAYGGVLADTTPPIARCTRPRRRSRANSASAHLEYCATSARRTALAAARTCTSPSSRSCPTVEANLLAIPRKQRAMVRKGIKAGLVGEIDADTDALLRRCTPTTCTATARRRFPRYFACCARPSATPARCSPCSPEGKPVIAA